MDNVPAINIVINGYHIDIPTSNTVKITDHTLNLNHESAEVTTILKYLVSEGFILNNQKKIKVTIQRGIPNVNPK